MRTNRTNRWIWFAAGLVAAGLSLPAVSSAQGPVTSYPFPSNNSMTAGDSRQTNVAVQENYLGQMLGDPKEEAAYQAFHKADEPAKKIKLGNAFLAKYPADRYAEAVYEELAQAYYEKQDLPGFYTFSDKGLSLFPNDVHLLALTGWVIPRAYKHDDPDGDKRLDKAVAYEKHALAAIGALPKPDGVSNQEFDRYKTGEAAIAHSGLGLVYFRQHQFEDSAKELQAATSTAAKPDQTDYYVLGADFENLNQHKEAADAFNHCAQIAGGLQGNCKKFSDDAAKEAAQAK
jgi:tetratricopeptide (TPR) repeat protein